MVIFYSYWTTELFFLHGSEPQGPPKEKRENAAHLKMLFRRHWPTDCLNQNAFILFAYYKYDHLWWKRWNHTDHKNHPHQSLVSFPEEVVSDNWSLIIALLLNDYTNNQCLILEDFLWDEDMINCHFNRERYYSKKIISYWCLDLNQGSIVLADSQQLDQLIKTFWVVCDITTCVPRSPNSVMYQQLLCGMWLGCSLVVKALGF